MSNPAILFLVLVISTLADALLLAWCWSQDRTDRTLLWCSAGYVFVAAGCLLLSGHAGISDLLSADLAIFFVILGNSLAWAGARTFAGRPVHLEVIAVGPLLWLFACRIPAFHGTYEAMVCLSALISATYCLAAAREFWNLDALRGRCAVVIVLAIHSTLLLSRAPLVIAEINQLFTPPFLRFSFNLMAFEAILFAQAFAFLIVALTKERILVEFRTAALTDSLTELPNRRSLLEQGASLIAHYVRHQRPISVVMLDLDHFKGINDTFGHAIGDAVLRRFSEAARATLRRGDRIGRIGGEEFAVILPDANEEQACVATRRLLTALTKFTSSVEGHSINATASAGLVTLIKQTRSIDELLRAADNALFEGKRKKRGRIWVTSLPAPDADVATAKAFEVMSYCRQEPLDCPRAVAS